MKPIETKASLLVGLLFLIVFPDLANAGIVTIKCKYPDGTVSDITVTCSEPGGKGHALDMAYELCGLQGGVPQCNRSGDTPPPSDPNQFHINPSQEQGRAL